MDILKILIEWGKTIPRFLGREIPEAIIGLGETVLRLSSGEVIDAVAELGRTSLRYLQAARELVIPGASRALLDMAVAWYVVVLAIVAAGVLWWVNRL